MKKKTREFVGGPKDGEPVPDGVTASRYIHPEAPDRTPDWSGDIDLDALDALDAPPRFVTHTYVRGSDGDYHYEGRTE